ncbi:MAG: ChbG/HpnK family deacetylase [Erysipelotrichaceae bacterium]|nr:ChbG/HpnK family deacetylase [Erysipelotrichaceae bacterium]
MITRLIINCDDFGLTREVSDGIIKAYQEGPITSTTVMVNEPYAKECLIKLQETCPEIGLGLHLNITHGSPLTHPATLVDQHQRFLRPNYYHCHFDEVDEEEIYQEWLAQLKRFIEITGHLPDHLDSHHNIHLRFSKAYGRLSREYQIPVRDMNGYVNDFPRLPVYCFDEMTIDLLDHLCHVYEGTLELMTHPGIVTEELKQISSYAIERQEELDFWTSDEVKAYLESHHIQCISYQDLIHTDV